MSWMSYKSRVKVHQTSVAKPKLVYMCEKLVWPDQHKRDYIKQLLIQKHF